MTAIKLQKLYKSFGEAEIIKGVDLEIEEREFVVFVGPSGCGKSTLLRLIAGLEDVTDGEILIGEQRATHLTPSERGIAMVFQSYALYPHMSVYENMAFGLKIGKKGKAEIEERVQEAANILQLTKLLKHTPKQLSGGQRQRVAIGRAIVRNPKVFLFDEPLSNLDASLRVQMRIEIAKLHEKLKATMIYVTHDQVEAMTLADKIVVLRAGKIEQVGSPLELYHQPRNLFVAGFLGSPTMNFISTKVVRPEENGIRVVLPGDREIVVPVEPKKQMGTGAKVTLGIRPEIISIGESENCAFHGTVTLVEKLGSESYVYCDLPDHVSITVRLEGAAALREGDTVPLTFSPLHTHVFDMHEIALPRLKG